MNQLELTATMKRHYGARAVSTSSAGACSPFYQQSKVDRYLFSKNDRSFQLLVKYDVLPDVGSFRSSMLLEERIMPVDNHGEVRCRPLVSADPLPDSSEALRRWLNRQLIAAFLHEPCETPPTTTP